MADSKKYDGSQWEHSLRKLTTATEAVENPLYSDGTAITAYTIKGNTTQSGTPTPSNPVPVVGVGELETTGEHTGEYKIPILNNSQTTNVYLGEVQTTRKIEKYEFTGQEDDTVFKMQSSGLFYLKIRNILTFDIGYAASSHYKTEQVANVSMSNLSVKQDASSSFGSLSGVIVIKHTEYTTLADFKTYLQQQYAAGTPVIIYYALNTATTGTVNEPLMKIGDYADTLSNATAIPTTDGANSITVDTTVQPSEFTATWTGWHDSSVKEYDGSDWQ